jgi:uncharacterized protein
MNNKSIQIVNRFTTIPDTNPILLGRAGSRSYGTETEESDDDYMGIFMGTRDSYLGLKDWNNNDTYELKVANGADCDVTVYELKKFIRLALKFNPNVIPLLWILEEDIIWSCAASDTLRKHRHLFLSRELYFPFVGYAKGQVNKIKNGLTGKMGAKRKDWADKFGYDTKFAMHTVRLMRMAIEALETGEINVFRNDAEELKQIRNGAWSLDRFFKESDDLMKRAIESYQRSKLPLSPDFAAMNKIVIELIGNSSSK